VHQRSSPFYLDWNEDLVISTLTPSEIKLITDLVEYPRGPGYVLDLSDRTIRAFFGEMDIDIDSTTYQINGTSKGNRVRILLRNTSDATAAIILKKLWDYRAEILARTGDTDPVPHSQGRFLIMLHRLLGTGASGTPPAAPPPPEGAAQDALRAELWRIKELPPQARGYEFERFLTRYFRESGLEPREPFRNRGEQIDGSFLLWNETYLVEAKYQAARTGVDDLRSFQGKVTDKASWARGLFIAFEGFTEVGLDAFGRGKRIILMCGPELDDALLRRLPLREVLDRKVRAAAENGHPFNSVKDLFAIAVSKPQ